MPRACGYGHTSFKFQGYLKPHLNTWNVHPLWLFAGFLTKAAEDLSSCVSNAAPVSLLREAKMEMKTKAHAAERRAVLRIIDESSSTVTSPRNPRAVLHSCHQTKLAFVMADQAELLLEFMNAMQ